MKVLVTGANGFLGSHVVERLLRSNHDVTALIRPASKPPCWSGKVRIFKIDLRAPSGLEDALQGIDTVVHVAAATSGTEDMQFASTVGGTEKLLAAMAKAGVRRLVHISSFVVYDWAHAGRTLDESTPLETAIYGMGGYAIAKFWQERIVLRHAEQNNCKTVILRPGFIWGAGHAEISGMGRSFGRLFMVISPANVLPLTHVRNCADCIGAAVEADLPSGEVFNVVDKFKVSTWGYTGDVLKGSKKRAWRFPVPYWLGMAVARGASAASVRRFGPRGQLPSLLAKRRFQAQFRPLHFSTSKLTRVLKWTPPLSYRQCLEETFPE